MNDKPIETIDCTDIRAMLSGLLDDQVAAETRYLAERHLAECPACRELLSEAERNEALIAAEAASHGSPEHPQQEFEAAVLSRTVYAQRRRAAANRWTAWVGWLAAAAALFLAISIWELDRRASLSRSIPQGIRRGAPVIRAASYPTGAEIKSWTLDRAFPGDAPLILSDAAVTKGLTHIIAPQEPAKEQRTVGLAISRDDAETLDSVSLALAMLAQADDRSFADVDQVRRITEYDHLLPRLADAHRNLPLADRPAVLAAESVLYRVMRGPLDLDEVREIREAIAHLNLVGRIDAISGRWTTASSL